MMVLCHICLLLVGAGTAWKVSKYGPEKTPYLDTFHVVQGSGHARGDVANRERAC